MASEAKTEEPTMEEILASIRRIISEDNEPEGEKPAAQPAPKAEAAPAKPAAPKPAPPKVAVVEEADEDEDVLELTEIVPDEDGEELGQADVDSLFDEAEDVVLVEREQDAPEQESDDDTFPEPDDEPEEIGLVSAAVVSRASTSFASLARTVRVVEPGSEPGSLEEIVRGMLKPLLQDWLDQNLPTIVERLVQAEIDRVARKGRS